MFECTLCHGPLVPLPDSTLAPVAGDQSNSPPRIPVDTPGIVITLCGHLFHGLCLQDWFAIQSNAPCPTCGTNSLLVKRVYPTVATKIESPSAMESTASSSNQVESHCGTCKTLQKEIKCLASTNKMLTVSNVNSVLRSASEMSASFNGKLAAIVEDNKNLTDSNESLRQKIVKIGQENQLHRDEIQLFQNKKQTLLRERGALRLEKKAINDEYETLRSSNETLRKENERLRKENGALHIESPTPGTEEKKNVTANEKQKFWARFKKFYWSGFTKRERRLATR